MQCPSLFHKYCFNLALEYCGWTILKCNSDAFGVNIRKTNHQLVTRTADKLSGKRVGGLRIQCLRD
jgi:hypothetical protein